MLSSSSKGAALPIVVGIQENIFVGKLAASVLSNEDNFWLGTIKLLFGGI